MKNLVMTVAAAATMLFAAENVNAQEGEEVAVTTTELQAPVEGYTKIDVADLPDTVTKAVAEDKEGGEAFGGLDVGGGEFTGSEDGGLLLTRRSLGVPIPGGEPGGSPIARGAVLKRSPFSRLLSKPVLRGGPPRTSARLVPSMARLLWEKRPFSRSEATCNSRNADLPTRREFSFST